MTTSEICENCAHLNVCKWADKKEIGERVSSELDNMFVFELSIIECCERIEVVL